MHNLVGTSPRSASSQVSEQSFEILRANDQLLKAKREGKVAKGYSEVIFAFFLPIFVFVASLPTKVR